jgi:pimeloyl-ACP methyl ester carboxylesterase
MTSVRATALAIAALMFLANSPLLTSDPAAAASVTPSAVGVAYLFRGGFNVFSTGVDVLAAKLRARGVDATAYGNADWPAVTGKAKARYAATDQPIVLVGHSFGANAAVLLAAELNKSKTPVALLILYDTVSSMKVTGNVRRVVDFVSTDGRTAGIAVTGELDFIGRVDRIDAPQGHFTVDKHPR